MSRRLFVRNALRVLAVAAIYFVAGKVGLSLAFINASATAVWPPTGIAIAALLVFGRDVWPGVLIGAFLVNSTTAGSLPTSLAIAAGNTLEGLAAMALVQRFASGVRTFDRPSRVFRFALLAGGLSTMVSASIGVATLSTAGMVATAQIPATWFTWWFGDLTGALVVAPLMMLAFRPPTFEWKPGRLLELCGLAIALVAIGSLVFFDLLRSPGGPAMPAYVVVPIILWAATRFTALEASAAVVVLSGIAIMAALRGSGPYALADPNSSLLLVQGFMAVWSVTSLALASAVADRRREAQRTRSRNELLERRASERTRRLRETNDRLRRNAAERRRAEERLRQSELRLREAQRVAHMGSWEWDIDANRVWWSEELFAIYGLEYAESGSPIEDFIARVHPEDRERVMALVNEACQKGEAFSFDHRILRADGAVRTLHAIGHVLTDEQGRAIRMMGTGHDITERQQIEAERAEWIHEQAARREAVQANQLKDEFLAILSHELRNPLNAIVVWSQLLREGRLDEVETARAVDAIARNAQVQNKLISDLLDLSRLNSGRLALRRRVLDLARVVEEALETMRPLAESKNVRIAATLYGVRQPRVMADAERLQQIVWNLVSNAIHFSPAGAVVDVALLEAGEELEIRVEDRGPGIAPELLPVMFDAVRRGATSLPGRSGGLGLGLAIVRRLAELHGGSVAAANRPEGGALLTVRLPRLAAGAMAADEPAATNGEMPGASGETALRGIRVLLVEDDFDSAEGLAHILTSHGAQVETAGTCAEGLERFETSPPHVLISDIALPDRDGYELLEQVRRLDVKRGGQVPAIALTAYAGVEHSRRATQAGFEVHFSKPFEAEELVEVIARLTGE